MVDKNIIFRYFLILLAIAIGLFQVSSKYIYNQNGVYFRTGDIYGINVSQLPNNLTIIKVDGQRKMQGFVYFSYQMCVYNEEDAKQYGLINSIQNVSIIVNGIKGKNVDICKNLTQQSSTKFTLSYHLMLISSLLCFLKLIIVFPLCLPRYRNMILLKCCLMVAIAHLCISFIGDWLLLFSKGMFYSFAGVDENHVIQFNGLPRTLIHEWTVLYLTWEYILCLVFIALISIIWSTRNKSPIYVIASPA
uniref:TIGR01906 family membrane protein n=1 Tax=Rhabditophanes sp. KR3021 TaxID=114890 RepID=A0AC35UA44_9BILA